ncbi:uncharacterized protein K441DRAFT_716452, partial [Cenococcum geophilum 1.58]|uniref:uncharacterized protein n=1 Tax=Cenococcum geophilum 1.58 TaxID=794803 RepID=UPI00358F5C51
TQSILSSPPAHPQQPPTTRAAILPSSLPPRSLRPERFFLDPRYPDSYLLHSASRLHRLTTASPLSRTSLPLQNSSSLSGQMSIAKLDRAPLRDVERAKSMTGWARCTDPEVRNIGHRPSDMTIVRRLKASLHIEDWLVRRRERGCERNEYIYGVHANGLPSQTGQNGRLQVTLYSRYTLLSLSLHLSSFELFSQSQSQTSRSFSRVLSSPQQQWPTAVPLPSALWPPLAPSAPARSSSPPPLSRPPYPSLSAAAALSSLAPPPPSPPALSPSSLAPPPPSPPALSPSSLPPPPPSPPTAPPRPALPAPPPRLPPPPPSRLRRRAPPTGPLMLPLPLRSRRSSLAARPL